MGLWRRPLQRLPVHAEYPAGNSHFTLRRTGISSHAPSCLSRVGRLSARTPTWLGLATRRSRRSFSPANPGKFVWGVGPAFFFPTASSSELGSGEWGLGPSIVGLYIGKKIVAGALLNNIWSFAGWGDKPVNAMTLQPFINYNFPGGWYLTFSPIITANWIESAGNVWTVPLGGGFGKIVHFGKLPVNLSVQFFGYAVTPENGPTLSFRLQCQFLFPK